MATDSRRVRSQFVLGDTHREAIKVGSVKLVFAHRTDRDRFTEPYSRWGQEQGRRTCILYFDFMVHEMGQKCRIKNAKVKIDFSAMELDVFHVTPAEEFRARSSEMQYSQKWTFGPDFKTPWGGANLGSTGGERVFQGVPDWRFSGNILKGESQCVEWMWIRGAHYGPSRGMPAMAVGVAARNNPQTAFRAAVTMSVKHQFPWRQFGSVKIFYIEFRPPAPQTDDLSTLVLRFLKDRWRPLFQEDGDEKNMGRLETELYAVSG